MLELFCQTNDVLIQRFAIDRKHCLCISKPLGKFLDASKNQKNFDDRFDTVFHISICHRSTF